MQIWLVKLIPTGIDENICICMKAMRVVCACAKKNHIVQKEFIKNI